MPQHDAPPDRRVCHACGREPVDGDFFCRGCATRLDNPAGYVAPTVRADPVYRTDGPSAVVILAVEAVLLVAATVAAFLVLDPFGADPATPGEVAESYLDALGDGDCAAAAELEANRTVGPSECARATRALGGDRLTDVTVEDALVLDDQATVTVRVTVEKTSFVTYTFGMDRDDDRWLIGSVRAGDPRPVP